MPDVDSHLWHALSFVPLSTAQGWREIEGRLKTGGQDIPPSSSPPRPAPASAGVRSELLNVNDTTSFCVATTHFIEDPPHWCYVKLPAEVPTNTTYLPGHVRRANMVQIPLPQPRDAP
jgi:hypothetical protein